jgi:hypothetical protein
LRKEEDKMEKLNYHIFKNYKPVYIPVRFGNRHGRIFSIDEKSRFRLAKKYASRLRKMLEDKHYEARPSDIKMLVENYISSNDYRELLIRTAENLEKSELASKIKGESLK